jgi:hypothetical protein
MISAVVTVRLRSTPTDPAPQRGGGYGARIGIRVSVWCFLCVDHDQACCPDEKRSCGNCIRGLLCLAGNTALGHIERKLGLAQAYLAAPPAKVALPGLRGT